MQNNTKITEVKNKLPLGGKVLISQRTGLTKQTVDNILNGKNARVQNVLKVIKEAEKIISKYKEVTEG